MKELVLCTAILLSLAWPLCGQTGVTVYGQTIDLRSSTRIGYWNTNANEGVGQVAISFGRPRWKEDYARTLDQLTKGKMWRMGDNFWTILDTNLPCRIGEVDVPVGYYYLAIQRSEDGSKWSLVFIEPERSRKKGLDAYDVLTRKSEIPVLFTASLTFEETDELVERLTILLSLNAGSQTDGTMRLSWGNFALSAPVKVTLPRGN